MKPVTVFLSLIIMASYSHAQNRNSQDTIFNEPAKAGWTQIFLGFVELVAAEQVFPGLEFEQKALRNAEWELQYAQDLATSESQLQNSIKMLEKRIADEVGDEVALQSRLDRLKLSSVVTQAEKQKLIEAAKSNITQARKVALATAERRGLLQKGIKSLRVVGSTLLVMDVIGRIYVWNALDANPTLSPGVTYIEHLISK